MPVVLDPDLGGQEDIAAGDAGVGDGFTDFRFIAIDLRGVHMAEANLQRMRNDPENIGTGYTESAEAEGRNGGSVGGYVVHGFLLGYSAAVFAGEDWRLRTGRTSRDNSSITSSSGRREGRSRSAR